MVGRAFALSKAVFSGHRVAVVAPAFNEERLIDQMIRSVPEYVDRIFVVDDASSDRTVARALKADPKRVEVLSHHTNKGVGAAIATGYQAAIQDGADLAVVLAGDGQMHTEDLPALLAPIINGNAEYTKGDRLSWPNARSHMPILRYAGNHVLSWLTRKSTGLSIQDSQCGYTAISKRALHALDWCDLWPRYGYPNDLIGRLKAAQLRVQDVPVRPIYATEESGIGWRHALVVIPFVLSRVFIRRVARKLSERMPKPALSAKD